MTLSCFSCDKIADKLAVYDYTSRNCLTYTCHDRSHFTVPETIFRYLCFTLSPIKDRSSFLSEGMLSCPFVLVLPCFYSLPVSSNHLSTYILSLSYCKEKTFRRITQSLCNLFFHSFIVSCDHR